MKKPKTHAPHWDYNLRYHLALCDMMMLMAGPRHFIVDDGQVPTCGDCQIRLRTTQIRFRQNDRVLQQLHIILWEENVL